MKEDQKDLTYHSFDFLKKRKNEAKWRPLYLEAIDQRNKKRIKILSFIIIIELIILGYLILFNPKANQESIVFNRFEGQLYCVKEQVGNAIII